MGRRTTSVEVEMKLSSGDGASDDRSAPRSLDILIISTYYWPERAGNAPYVTGVAEYLASRGHRVVVATGFRHYPEWQSSQRGILGVREQRNGVEIRRRRHYVPRMQSAKTRALYEASLCASGITALPRSAPDVIIGVSPTLTGAMLARVAAGVYGRPYGLVFQDLQGPGARQSGVKGGRDIAALVERMEVGLARQAAAVGIIAGGFRTYFEGHGVPATTIHDLRNWSQDAHPTEAIAEARARLGWAESDFVCLHAGNMGHKQGLENVLLAAAALTDPDIRVVLAGDGNERATLEALADELHLSNVSFLPPQPTGLYEAMLCAADVLLVNQRSSVGDMSLASKLTSYFMAARPVIGAATDRSETARELTRAGAGVLTPPEEPAALADAIAWVKSHPEDAGKLGTSGRRYAERHLTAESALGDYERFVLETSRGQVPGVIRCSRGRPWQVADPKPQLIQARPAAGSHSERAVVSLVIVSYDCRKALERCLASIETQPADLPLQAIVVDNASHDDTVAAITEQFPWVCIIANQSNTGFAHAVNQAIEIAEGDYVLALNPDTVTPPGTIAKAVEELERRPDVGVLGCRLVRPDGTFDHACKRGFPTIASSLYYFVGLHRMWPTSPRFAQYTAGHLGPHETGLVDAVNGAFMLVRREAARDVGPMDERYWLYAEDIDWCHRFWEKGWKVLYWPKVEVTHWKGGSAGDTRPWNLNRAFHRSMWLFYAKHYAARHPRPLSAIVWVGVWLKFALTALGNAIRRPSRHGWKRATPARGLDGSDRAGTRNDA